MAARLTYTFDSGTDAAALSQAGLTVSGTITYSAANTVHGALAVVTPNDAASNYFRGDLGANPTLHSSQIYFRVAASAMTGSGETTVARLAQVGSNTALAQFKVNGNSKFLLCNFDNTVKVTSTGTYSVAAANRVVLQWDDTVATAVVVKALLFYGANLEGSTPDETLTLPSFNPAAAFGRWMWGNVGTPTPSANRQIAIDSVQVEDGIVTMAAFAPSTTNLVVADAAQAMVSDGVVLSPVYDLAPAAAAQAQVADGVALVQNSSLVVQDSAQAQVTDNVALSSADDLGINSADQAQVADAVTLTQEHNLTVADAAQAQVAGTGSLVQESTLTVAGTAQAQTTDAPTLTQVHVLTVQGVAQAITSTNVPLGVPALTWGPHAGGQTDSGFTAAFRTTSVGSVRMAVSTVVGMTSPVYSSSVTPDAFGIGQCSITGLTPNVQYYCALELDGVLNGTVGRARTFPTPAQPANYSVLISSCAKNDSNDGVFDLIRTSTGIGGLTPLLFVHLGDDQYVYSGTTAPVDESALITAHERVFSQSKQAQLRREIPHDYVYSDVDFCGSNTDGQAAARNEAASAVRRMFASHPLPSTVGSLERSYRLGRLRVIHTDGRSNSSDNAATDNSGKTMLGAEQKAWFKAEVLQAKVDGDVVLWFHDNDFLGSALLPDGTQDQWRVYNTERVELVNYIVAQDMSSRLVYVHGDTHTLKMDDGTNNVNYGGFATVCASPMHQQGTTYVFGASNGFYPASTVTASHQWVQLDVTDTGQLMTLDFSGMEGSTTATERISMVRTFVMDADLVINAAAQAQVTGSPTLAVNSTLDVGFAAQAMSSGTTALDVTVDLDPDDSFLEMTSTTVTGEYGLVVQDALQAQVAGSPSTTQESTLVVQDATQGQSSPTVTTISDVTADPAAHAVTSSTVELAQLHLLQVQSATQAQQAGSATLAAEATLTVSDATQAQSAGSVELSGVHFLSVDPAGQTQVAGVVPVSLMVDLVVQTSAQSQLVGSVILAQLHQLVVQDAAQTSRAQRVFWDGVVEYGLYWWDGTTKTPVVVRGMWDGESVLPVTLTV